MRAQVVVRFLRQVDEKTECGEEDLATLCAAAARCVNLLKFKLNGTNFRALQELRLYM